MPQGDLVSVYNIKDTEIYEDNNWDLNEGFNDRDCNFYEKKEEKGIRPNRDKDGKIPLNLGCGVRMRDKYGQFLYTDKDKAEGYDREVTLNVTSWIGTSPGAIHYYGNMHFRTCTVHPEGQPTCSTSCWDIPLFGSGNIQLTRELEAWEFKRYPKTYDGWHPGDNYSGFYTPEDVIARGKQVFKDLFGKGWKLKIDRRY